jgi:hypothetical protein
MKKKLGGLKPSAKASDPSAPGPTIPEIEEVYRAGDRYPVTQPNPQHQTPDQKDAVVVEWCAFRLYRQGTREWIEGKLDPVTLQWCVDHLRNLARELASPVSQTTGKTDGDTAKETGEKTGDSPARRSRAR